MGVADFLHLILTRRCRGTFRFQDLAQRLVVSVEIRHVYVTPLHHALMSVAPELDLLLGPLG